MKTWNFFLFALLFCCTLCVGQNPDCNTLTLQALEMSGVNQSVSNMAELVYSDEFIAQIQNGRQAPENLVEYVKDAARKSFTAEMIRKDLQERMAARCVPEKMAEAIQRMQTPTMVRMIALENEANTPEGQRKLKRYVNIARTVPPPEDRMDAINGLDRVAGVTAFATDAVISITCGMLSGSGAPENLIAEIKDHRKEMRTQMQPALQLAMSVTYHGVTRPELQRYATELSNPALRWFNEQVRAAFLEVLEERAHAMGAELTKSVPAKTSQGHAQRKELRFIPARINPLGKPRGLLPAIQHHKAMIQSDEATA